MAELIAAIATHQDIHRMTDRAVADWLGIPRSTWTAARNGRFRPGLPFAHQVSRRREFRRLARAVLVPPRRGHAPAVPS